MSIYRRTLTTVIRKLEKGVNILGKKRFFKALLLCLRLRRSRAIRLKTVDTHSVSKNLFASCLLKFWCCSANPFGFKCFSRGILTKLWILGEPSYSVSDAEGFRGPQIRWPCRSKCCQFCCRKSSHPGWCHSCIKKSFVIYALPVNIVGKFSWNRGLRGGI